MCVLASRATSVAYGLTITERCKWSIRSWVLAASHRSASAARTRSTVCASRDRLTQMRSLASQRTVLPNPSFERTANGVRPVCAFARAVPPLAAAQVKR
jgi:hypothetical protein